MMKEFDKWYRNYENSFDDYVPDINDTEAGWKGALEWHQKIANTCEEDCETSEDYKILYIHLKQVLKNELED